MVVVASLSCHLHNMAGATGGIDQASAIDKGVEKEHSGIRVVLGRRHEGQGLAREAWCMVLAFADTQYWGACDSANDKIENPAKEQD